MSACMVCDGVVGLVEGEGVRMRGLLWGPVVHAPLGGSNEGALPSGRPARRRVGPSSVAVLQVAERVLPIVAAARQLRRRILRPWR